MTNFSPAGQALGLGGSFADQVLQESEAERKKRLAALAMSRSKIGANANSGYGAALSTTSAEPPLGGV